MIIKLNQNELLEIIERQVGQKIKYIELSFSDHNESKGSFVNKKNLSKIENVDIFEK